VIVSRTPARRHAEELAGAVGVGQQLGRGPGPGHPPLVDDDGVGRHPADDGQVLLDEQDRHLLGRTGQHVGDLRDQQRSQPLGGLVDQQQLVVVEQQPGDRHHLLLTARQRPGELAAALLQLGEEVVDPVVVVGGVPPLGEGEVLGDGQPTEHLAILGRIPDAQPDDVVRAPSLQPVHPAVVAGELDGPGGGDQAQHGLDRRRLAGAVAAEQRGDPAAADGQVHPLQDVAAREAHVHVGQPQQRWRRHSLTPRSARLFAPLLALWRSLRC
jgi:hypothetical protein